MPLVGTLWQRYGGKRHALAENPETAKGRNSINSNTFGDFAHPFQAPTDYESAVRLAVSLGGDSDTIACIAGGIAQAPYGGVPAGIRDQAPDRLNDHLRSIVEEFEVRFP